MAVSQNLEPNGFAIPSLPDDVELCAESLEDWERLVRLLPLNSGPRMLFVLVDSPVLRRRLADHLIADLQNKGDRVAKLDFTTAYYQPLQEIFDAAAEYPDARYCFLFGLERSLMSPEHRLSALTDLNLHRDQILKRLSCPLVIWTPDETLTDLACNAPDFTAWRGSVFSLADPAAAIEAPYRQHIIDRFSKLTLYSATSDAPLGVDLEQVFVKLSATHQQTSARPLLDSIGSLKEGNPRDLPSASSFLSGLLSRDREWGGESTGTLSIDEALKNHRRLAIVGAPGSGKTTLLRYLALTFARRQGLERLGVEEDRLPLFVALRDFSRFLDEQAQKGKLPELDPVFFVRFFNKHIGDIAPHIDLPGSFFSDGLETGRFVVLFDGLDEVAEPHKRARVAEAIAAFTREYNANRFVVASRPRGYEGEAQQLLAPLYHGCAIRDFDDDDMARFAHSWYAAVIRDRMGETQEALAEAQRQAQDLLRAIHADGHVKTLAHNPLLLSVLAMVHQRDVTLPQRRAELYDECTDMLLGYWDQTKGGEAARELANYGNLVRGEKRALLEPIALWFHERGEQGLEAQREELEREIALQFVDLFGDDQETAHKRAALFLQVIDERAGLLVERETGSYAFSHLTFQEYLAARAIANREDYIDYTLQRLHDSWWQEVILLEVDHLSDVRNFRHAKKRMSNLIRAIRDAGS